jgi:hypothetical protein
MTYEEFQEFVRGKVFLIGIDFYDSGNRLLEQYQTSGRVEQLTDTGMLLLRRDDEGLFALPYDHTAISQAPPGEYTERSSGKVIVNPDYIISGDIEVKAPENVENIKANGFYPVAQ